MLEYLICPINLVIRSFEDSFGIRVSAIGFERSGHPFPSATQKNFRSPHRFHTANNFVRTLLRKEFSR
jgi:hypothetical protein